MRALGGRYDEGDVYEGEYKDGDFNGRGTYKCVRTGAPTHPAAVARPSPPPSVPPCLAARPRPSARAPWVREGGGAGGQRGGRSAEATWKGGGQHVGPRHGGARGWWRRLVSTSSSQNLSYYPTLSKNTATWN